MWFPRKTAWNAFHAQKESRTPNARRHRMPLSNCNACGPPSLLHWP
ncbi:MAG: hypothetical protein J6C78_09735 [Muribaculaceae bacterium]|nr:hypothetical protein [Muribaculaceae bacterium]